MNGIQLALCALHHGERHLADALLAVAGRHRTEHEVHHVATDVAAWSLEHVRRLTEAAADHGLDPEDPASTAGDVMSATPRHEAAAPPDHSPGPGLLLLRDLSDLHLAATHNSLRWEMLAQAAQATKNTGLLDLASSCHPQTLRQMRWTNTMIKNLSPQILTSL
ncbi:hypothetical protein [Streptomyces diastaticus]|uniref:hypothetical protein n=1 Tax=Streptomyces diastaticus TaxID=1956 RepID=UPI0035DEF768